MTPASIKNFPIVDRKIKVGIVGCGRISAKHFEAIEKHQDNLELTFVCDNHSERLAESEKKYQVPGYPDMETALSKSPVDMVILTTPSGIHPDQAVVAAKAGVHVLTEKPMAVKLADGRRMVETCEKSGVMLFVVKQNRFNTTVQKLKQAIDKGRFGRLFFVQVNVFWTRPQAYYDAAPWRGTWEFDGGATMNQASHYVDLLTWMVGPVESVAAHTATLDRKIEAEDSAAASLRWKQGTLGTINVSMLTYPKNLEGSLTILGENGTVRLGGVALNSIDTWDFADKQPEDDISAEEANYQTECVYGFGHSAYYRNVIGSLRGTEEPMTSGRSGLKSLELIEAIYRSAASARAVQLPLEG